ACVKHTPIGNFIVIRNTNTGREYVEAGFGLERIAAHQYKGDLYLLPKIAEMVEALTLLGHEDTKARQLITMIRSIDRIVLEGIVPGNKKREYILRYLIRKVALILINNKSEKIHTDIILCNLDEIFLALSSCSTDFSCRDVLLNEVRKYLETIRKALFSARTYILREKLVESADSIRKIKETFGLPDFLIWNIIKKRNE
ncbi:hypothetical protein KA005_19320, partial [bacterium]|nr:hypothetical protein [bacterium]